MLGSLPAGTVLGGRQAGTHPKVRAAHPPSPLLPPRSSRRAEATTSVAFAADTPRPRCRVRQRKSRGRTAVKTFLGASHRFRAGGGAGAVGRAMSRAASSCRWTAQEALPKQCSSRLLSPPIDPRNFGALSGGPSAASRSPTRETAVAVQPREPLGGSENLGPQTAQWRRRTARARTFAHRGRGHAAPGRGRTSACLDRPPHPLRRSWGGSVV